jgi:polyisoprenoid-binding protein YceI
MSHHSKIHILFIGIALLVILVTGCSPVATQTQTPNVENQVPSTGATSTATAAQPPAVTAATPPSTVGSSPSASGVKYVLVPEKSEASYAVREQLAGRDFPNDAVGRTNAIEGSITLNPDGTVNPASRFTVDLSTLVSDSPMRDNYIRRNTLKTDQNPLAVFVPTQISGLAGGIPQEGPVTFQVLGDLTINNVTKPVTWDVTGTISAEEAAGTATTNFTFGDFNLSQPRVRSVLNIVDKITLNVSVTLQRAGN